MSTGLDIYIDKAIDIFTNQLWVGNNNSFLGRSYRLKNDGRIQPCIYDETAKNGKYKEVFATLNYDSLVHFDIEPNNELIGQSQTNTDVNIFFAVNLSKVYGNDIRAVEQAKADIMNAIRDTSFNATGFVDQLPAYTDVYDLTSDQEGKFNMQPFYVIRIQTTIMAALGDCEPSTPVVKYKLDISHVGEGITNPDTGVYSRQAGTGERLIATEEAGNEFVKWTLNTVDSFNRILDVVYDGAKTAVATFQILITGYYQNIMKGGNNDIIQIDGKWKYSNLLGTGGVDISPDITDTQGLTLDGIGATVSNDYSHDGQTPYMQWFGKILGTSGAIIGSGNDHRITIIGGGTGVSFFYSKQAGGSSGLDLFNVISTNDVIRIEAYSDGINDYINLTNYTTGLTHNNTKTHDESIQSTNTSHVGSFNGVTLFSSIECYYAEYRDYTNINSGYVYHCQDAQGTVIKNRLGLNDGTLIGAIQAQAWGTKSDIAFPALLVYGYEQYESDTIPEQYIYVIRGVDGFFTPVIAGYTKIKEIEPNSGLSDTGNKILQPLGDVPLYELSRDYGLPFYGVSENDPQKVSYRDIIAIDLSGIPPEKFRYTNGDTVNNMQSLSS